MLARLVPCLAAIAAFLPATVRAGSQPALAIEAAGARIVRPDTVAAFSTLAIRPDGLVTAERGTFRLQRDGRQVRGTIQRLDGRLQDTLWRFEDLRLVDRDGVLTAASGTFDAASGEVTGVSPTIEHPRLRVQAKTLKAGLSVGRMLLEGDVRGELTP